MPVLGCIAKIDDASSQRRFTIPSNYTTHPLFTETLAGHSLPCREREHFSSQKSLEFTSLSMFDLRMNTLPDEWNPTYLEQTMVRSRYEIRSLIGDRRFILRFKKKKTLIIRRCTQISNFRFLFILVQLIVPLRDDISFQRELFHRKI